VSYYSPYHSAASRYSVSCKRWSRCFRLSGGVPSTYRTPDPIRGGRWGGGGFFVGGGFSGVGDVAKTQVPPPPFHPPPPFFPLFAKMRRRSQFLACCPSPFPPWTFGLADCLWIDLPPSPKSLDPLSHNVGRKLIGSILSVTPPFLGSAVLCLLPPVVDL